MKPISVSCWMCFNIKGSTKAIACHIWVTQFRCCIGVRSEWRGLSHENSKSSSISCNGMGRSRRLRNPTRTCDCRYTPSRTRDRDAPVCPGSRWDSGESLSGRRRTSRASAVSSCWSVRTSWRGDSRRSAPSRWKMARKSVTGFFHSLGYTCASGDSNDNYSSVAGLSGYKCPHILGLNLWTRVTTAVSLMLQSLMLVCKESATVFIYLQLEDCIFIDVMWFYYIHTVKQSNWEA